MTCDEIRSQLMAAAGPPGVHPIEVDPPRAAAAPAGTAESDRKRTRLAAASPAETSEENRARPGPAGAGREVAEHMDECAACSEFAARLELARAALRDHRSEHLPDPHFARRVSAALPAGPDLLGWAAVRLLPATLGLALALTAWCWLATPGPGALVEQSPTDDLLAWALEEDGS